MNLALDLEIAPRGDVAAAVARFEQWMAVPESPIRAIRHQAARTGEFADIPSDLVPALKQSLLARAIPRLYSHQADAFRAVMEGRNVVIVTPTASGKTLCYNLPVLQCALQDPGARALYLFPAKALAEDQLTSFNPR
ncbi:MAG: DEAD/DEAH box helicase [Bryobacteraceae bacterium]